MPSAEKCAHAQSRQVSFHLNQIGRKNHVCSDFAQTEVNKELLIKPPCLVCLVFFSETSEEDDENRPMLR